MRISDQTLNRLAVLKAIRRLGPVSRSDLPKATGLSVGTISQLTSDLIQRGLIVETRGEAGRPGRPRLYLEIASDGAVVIGAALLDNGRFNSSFVDLAGHRLFSWEVQFNTLHTLHAFASTIANIIEEAIAASPFDGSEISRVAVSLPGLIDGDTGVVHWMTTFEEEPYPFGTLISERLGLPVTIENDSTCLARAEHWFGMARSLDDFSLFRVGMWFDAAQYAEGLPRIGGNGFNSEIGHVKTDPGPDARGCICGSRGCVAMYGSIFGVLLGAGKVHGIDLNSPVDLLPAYHEVLEAVNGGDQALRLLFEEAGLHLGIAIANHINAFDPANVLILADDPDYLALVRPSLESSIAGSVFRPMLQRTSIQIGMPIEDWRWKGTAAHALEQTYLGGS